MREYFGVAKELGIQQQEIETVQSIVMAVSGCRVRAQFNDARGLKPGPPKGRPSPEPTRQPGNTATRRKPR